MKKLLIIGGGNMGFAIASGIIKKGIYSKANIIFTEVNSKRISFLKKQRFQVFSNFTSLKKYGKVLDAILLAVKPNDISTITYELKKIISKDTLLISIAAGVKLKTLSSLLGTKQPLARVMPNTPCQIGEGMSVITFNKYAIKNQRNLTLKIFQSVGKVLELKENKFDLVTSVSGSGPAYFCYLTEGMIKSATKLGLVDKTARELVIQTAYGTVSLLTKSNITPEMLRKSVTSPKGTTEAAVKVFEKKNFQAIIYSAIKAAKDRATELGKKSFLCLFISMLLTSYFLFHISSYAEEPIQLSTEAEDIALTDDLNIARAQVAKYPNNPEAHFNLAIALSKTSLVEEAIKELRRTKLLIRKPENFGTIEKKISEYKEILNNNPEANNIRYRLAFSHYLKAYLITKEIEKQEKSKEQNNQKKKKDKSLTQIDLFGSHSLLLNDKSPLVKENLELSTYYFKELLKNNPNDNWAKIYYAFILVEQFGEINKAKELWTDVLKYDPSNPAPHFFLGELHIKEGNLKEGILEISQALLLRSLGH